LARTSPLLAQPLRFHLSVSLANSFGLPVSSGQAVVGAYEGERVNVSLLLGIVRSWIITPLVSGIFLTFSLSLLNSSYILGSVLRDGRV